MSRLRKRGPILTKGPTGGGSRANVDVDPVLAVLLGVVIVGGGGLAAFGASQDTEPEPAPAPIVQNDDPVVARALAIVERVDGTALDGDGDSAAAQRREAARAERASEKGRSTDPFRAIQSASAAVDSASSGATSGSTTTGGSSASPTEQAKQAAATAAAANAATQGATGGSKGSTGTTAGSTGTGTPATGSTTGSKAPSTTAASKAGARRLAATKPAKISLRIKTTSGRSTRSKRGMGLLVPNATKSVARVIGVSRTNRVVTLRLREGASLTGRQSKGTMCVERLSSGDCQLIRVRTGRTAIIRAPETPAGRLGAVTAIRVLAIWRGGYKLAD